MPYVIKTVPKQVDGSVNAVGGSVALPVSGTGVLVWQCFIQNTGNDTLLVSFDGGTTNYSLLPGANLPLQSNIHSVFLKAAATSTTYEILFTEATHDSE